MYHLPMSTKTSEGILPDQWSPLLNPIGTIRRGYKVSKVTPSDALHREHSVPGKTAGQESLLTWTGETEVTVN